VVEVVKLCNVFVGELIFKLLQCLRKQDLGIDIEVLENLGTFLCSGPSPVIKQGFIKLL
jgi:hypothetical protein